MKTYDLYLDSGPMKKKTYVHMPQLLGCIARGDTSDEAVERSPDAIRTFLGAHSFAGLPPPVSAQPRGVRETRPFHRKWRLIGLIPLLPCLFSCGRSNHQPPIASPL